MSQLYKKSYKVIMTDKKDRQIANSTMVPVKTEMLQYVNEWLQNNDYPLFAFSGQVNLLSQTFTVMVKTFIKEKDDNDENNEKIDYRQISQLLQKEIDSKIESTIKSDPIFLNRQLITSGNTVIECWGKLQYIK